MKRYLVGASFLVSQAWAQAALKATKPDMGVGPATSASGPSPWALFQLILALGIVVILLKFVLPRFLPSLKNRVQTSLGSTIKIEETAQFPGGNLMVVKVRDTTLLLGATAQSINLISDLTPKTEEPKAFFEMVDAAPGATAPQYAVIPDEADIPITPTAIRSKVSAVKDSLEDEPALESSVDHEELLRRLTRLQKLTR